MSAVRQIRPKTQGQWTRKTVGPCDCAGRPPIRDYPPDGMGEGSIWTCECGRQWYLRYDSKNYRRFWETDHFPMTRYKQ